MYSFRHTWSAESRRVGMPEHVRDAIMGHVNENPIADRYGGDGDWIERKSYTWEKWTASNCLPGLHLEQAPFHSFVVQPYNYLVVGKYALFSVTWVRKFGVNCCRDEL